MILPPWQGYYDEAQARLQLETIKASQAQEESDTTYTVQRLKKDGTMETVNGCAMQPKETVREYMHRKRVEYLETLDDESNDEHWCTARELAEDALVEFFQWIDLNPQ